MGQESVEEHEVLEYEEGENDPREFTPESSQEKPFCLSLKSLNLTNDGLLACFLLVGGTSNNLH